nr:MAG TPA: hypothetical protein [Ackermannviridae sp.]
MGTARCYTKSGSIEKYESNLWTSPISGNWSSLGILGTITTPDSNGNYTVTAGNNFIDSDTETPYYCFTEYAGVKKTFYFKKDIVSIIINVMISVIGYRDYAGNVVFNCTVSGDTKNILRDNSITLSYGVVTASGLVGRYTTRVTSSMTLLSPGIKYDDGKTYYIDLGSIPTVNPSSGKSSEYEWSISALTGS